MAKRAALKLSDLTAKKGENGADAAQELATETVRPASERRRGQTLRLTEDAWRQLKYLAVDQGRPAHDLLVEAINDLFRKLGKPPIA